MSKKQHRASKRELLPLLMVVEQIHNPATATSSALGYAMLDNLHDLLLAATAAQSINNHEDIICRCIREAGISVDNGTEMLEDVTATIGADIVVRAVRLYPTYKTAVMVIDNPRRPEPLLSLYAKSAAKALTTDDCEVQTVALIYRKGKKFSALLLDTGSLHEREEATQKVLCHVITNGENDLTAEEERARMARKCRANRSRLYAEMKRRGVRYLRGDKADIAIRQSATRRRTDLERLRRDFPEAYAACVSELSGSEYVAIRLRNCNTTTGDEEGRGDV